MTSPNLQLPVFFSFSFPSLSWICYPCDRNKPEQGSKKTSAFFCLQHFDGKKMLVGKWRLSAIEKIVSPITSETFRWCSCTKLLLSVNIFFLFLLHDKTYFTSLSWMFQNLPFCGVQWEKIVTFVQVTILKRGVNSCP